jgi:hypothetical protein
MRHLFDSLMSIKFKLTNSIKSIDIGGDYN